MPRKQSENNGSDSKKNDKNNSIKMIIKKNNRVSNLNTRKLPDLDNVMEHASNNLMTPTDFMKQLDEPFQVCMAIINKQIEYWKPSGIRSKILMALSKTKQLLLSLQFAMAQPDNQIARVMTVLNGYDIPSLLLCIKSPICKDAGYREKIAKTREQFKFSFLEFINRCKDFSRVLDNEAVKRYNKFSADDIEKVATTVIDSAEKVDLHENLVDESMTHKVKDKTPSYVM